jgi:hypothetical protein
MSQPAKFQIFRRKDAYVFGEEGVITTDPSPVQADGFARMLDARVIDGSVYTMLCNLPGFTLMHAWFKQDYPLPLHSHSADCMYYVVAGSARLGTEQLGPGDVFFVPADTPYTYHAGPEGVEVLEYRHTLEIDFQNYAKGKAFYDKAVETVIAKRDEWRAAVRPSEKFAR